VRSWGKIAALCLSVVLAGCVADEHRPPPPPPPLPSGTIHYVPKAPPPLIEEVQPAPPGPVADFIWKPGHWRWKGAEYVWRHGVWEHPPAKALEWIPPHWDNRPGGWVFVEGHYRY
jgi:WXXGXW repeat (2 copies)